ncbi:hypothetical protein ACFW2T_13890 [Streptomyces sp. NPDC058892]|uniref:hypothetical protein n=1 Tax=unclassified Streptomyces TaxID=2593676 RepID=UPI0036BCE057
MGGMKDKHREPGKGREDKQRPLPPGLDPVHPEPRQPSRRPGRQGAPRAKGPHADGF